MGDKRASTPPGIAWDTYSTDAIVATVHQLLEILAARAEANREEPEEESQDPGATSEAQSGNTTAAAAASGSTPLCWQYLENPNCGFRCRFCASECSRGPGHKLHSCWKCRHKK